MRLIGTEYQFTRNAFVHLSFLGLRFILNCRGFSRLGYPGERADLHFCDILLAQMSAGPAYSWFARGGETGELTSAEFELFGIVAHKGNTCLRQIQENRSYW